MNSTSNYKTIYKNLHAFHGKDTIYRLLKSLLVTIIIVIPAVIAFVLLELIFSFSPPVRLLLVRGMGALVALIVAVTIGFYLFQWMSFKRNLINVAYRVGEYYNDVKDGLGNALELYFNPNNLENYSPQLIEACLNQSCLKTRNKKFSNLLTVAAFVPHLKILLTEVAFVVLLLLLPFNLNVAVSRMLHPSTDYSDRALYDLYVFPGDTTVVKGEDLTIKSWTNLPGASSMVLKTDQTALDLVELKAGKKDTFQYTLRNVQDSLMYSISCSEIVSPDYVVRIIEPPILRQLHVKVSPPTYSNIPPFFLEENVGDIAALKGSGVTLNLQANTSLKEAKIIFDDQETLPLETRENRAGGAFTVSRNSSYYFSLRDFNGLQNRNPIQYHLNVISDQTPYVKLLSPGIDIDLAEDMIVPIAIEASDDFGLSRMQLGYQLLPEGRGDIDSANVRFQELKGFESGADQVNLAINWDLSSSDMLPTDVMVYFVRVYDNDNVSGPKMSDSKIYRARFPSMYELYEEIATNQDQAIDSIEQVYQKAQELKEKLDDMSIQMRRADELDWQQQQEIKDAINSQNDIQKQVEKLSEKVDEMISTMERNDLVSAETLKKYQELQRLVQEIMTPELQEAMQKLTEAMKSLDQKLVQKALEDLKQSQEAFNKSLERSISLLKKLKAEQRLDQLVKMSQQLTERQQKIEKESVQNNNGEKLAESQRKINKEVAKLSRALEDLKKDFENLPGAPQEQIEEAGSSLTDSSFTSLLDSLQKNLKQKRLKAARMQSRQASKNMQKVSQQLQQARDMMTGAMQKKIMQAMKQATRDLLALSKRQEALLTSTEETLPNSPHLRELAEKQNDLASALQRAIEQMFDASKESVYMNSNIGRQLGKALGRMKESLQDIEGQAGRKAVPKQSEAMSALNNAYKLLQQSMQQMMQGGGGGGMSMEQFLQQMQQMGRQQQGINQQSQGLGVGQQLSFARQAAMARLAAEQYQVRKSAEQLAKEAENMDQVLGDIDKIIDEMKKVEQDFRANRLTRETLQRQDRILSRMLDSQKSMREREYSKKRKAETGRSYLAKNPGSLPEGLGDRKIRLRQDLLRAKKEGYTKDYLDLIKKYFEAISNQEENAN